jgi:hypothetical protein
MRYVLSISFSSDTSMAKHVVFFCWEKNGKKAMQSPVSIIASPENNVRTVANSNITHGNIPNFKFINLPRSK